MANVLEGYIRPEELTGELGITKRTLSRWEQLRCGPPRIQIGRTILYKLTDVQEWLNQNAKGGNLRPTVDSGPRRTSAAPANGKSGRGARSRRG